MQFNINGAFNKAFKQLKRPHNWATFDALPRDLKEGVWYNVSNLTVTGENLSNTSCNAMREVLVNARRMQSQSTRATYGADHPQAQITLADLGL